MNHRKPFRDIGLDWRVFVVGAAMRLLEQVRKALDRTAAHLLEVGLEFPSFLPLDLQQVTRGVDPHPIAVVALAPCNDRGAELTLPLPQHRKAPDAVHFRHRDFRCHDLRQALPSSLRRRAGHALAPMARST
jgi:hypothetical protein